MTPSDFWQLMGKKLTYIQEGHQGPVVYDFTDTNCPFCHLLYVTEARLIREGKLTVRYVPVAIIKPSSMPEAAAILQADNPVAALQKAEDAIAKGMKTGKPANLARATDAIGKASPKTIAAIKKIEANNVFLQEIGVDDLPDIIYLPKKGKLGLITGLISEKKLTELLPQIQ
ncbi:Thiol:disulfide interchange protein DsbG [Acidithiobacillus ferridurans]|jgi:thiol:disulfide interchange protein DsbG|nr:Thiol:disulfide interchange protein DsbG [Acidithiobacillus ferridurans]